MAVPEAVDKAKPLKSLSQLLERSQANAIRLGYASDTLTRRLQEARYDPEGAKQKANEHAARMGVDIDAVVKKWASATPSPFPLATRPPNMQIENQTENREATSTISGEQHATSHDIDVPSFETQGYGGPEQDGDISPLPSTAHVNKRDDSKHKKVKAKSNQANVPNNGGARKVSMKTGFVADSMGPDATREGAITTESMDIDYTPSLFVSQTNLYPIHVTLPRWYTDIGNSRFEMKELAKKRPPTLTSLESLKNCVGRCEDQLRLHKPADKHKLMKLYEELRDHVHKAEFLPDINKFVVKKARILTVENGLPRIFQEEASFPADLKADSYHLYSRWMREDFSQDIFRGIIRMKGKDRSNDSFDTAYNRTSAKEHGANGLILGQWWPSQLCTVRDGAHGVTQGGISGENGKGAYSIVLSGGGGYHDQDDGDTIEYSGTESKSEKPTDATQQMITSSELGHEIRVIRSSHLPLKNKYRPEVGFRYDGLYKVTHFWLVDEKKQMYRFKMERCPGQEPIRYANAAKRPTQEEVKEFKKLR